MVIGGLPTMRAVREGMAAQGLVAEGHITKRPTYDADAQAARYERAMTRGAQQRIEQQSGYSISRADARAAAQAERAAVNAGTYVAPTGPRTVTILQGVTNRRQAQDFRQRQDAALLQAAEGYYNAGDEAAMQGALSQLSTGTQQQIAAQLGDYGASAVVQTYNYATWQNFIKRAGGAVGMTWPFKTGIYAKYFGKPAARFSAAGYVTAFNAGALDAADITQGTANNQYFYILAPQSAWKDAPTTMGGGGTALNWLFSKGDAAADAIGLPSLASIENFLKTVGRDAALLAAVGVAAWYLLHGRGGLRSWDD